MNAAPQALLGETVPRRPALRLALLSLLLAASEGVGLALLVPILGLLTPGAKLDAIGRGVAALGVPLRPEPLLALFVALVLVRAGAQLARDLTAVRFESELVDRLRDRAWRSLLDAEWRELASMRQSDSASLLSTSLDRVGYGVNQLLQLATAAVTLAAVGIACLAIAPGLALGCGVGGVLVFAAYRGVRRNAAALGARLNSAWARIYEVISENLGALRLVKIHGREEAGGDALASAFARMREGQLDWVRANGRARLALHGGAACLLAGMVLVTLGRDPTDAARLVPLVLIFARALPLLGTIQDTWGNWVHARPALDQTRALMRQLEAAAEPPADSGAPAIRLSRALTLENAVLRHEGRGDPVVDGITLTVPAGGTLLVTGPSGAGKSTIADILGGLVTPDAGTFAVDGLAVTAANRKRWRQRVAYVQQEPVLFHATIRENLLWACPEADEARLVAALREAAAEFVLALPAGLDTVVGDRGARLSGGERQRIALARGLLLQPDLLILDEVTSALDAANDRAVAGAIAALKGRMTIVIIGHRGALAELADRVIAVEHGRIVSDRPGAAAHARGEPDIRRA